SSSSKQRSLHLQEFAQAAVQHEQIPADAGIFVFSKTSSAAFGGPQLAIRAAIRMPNVFAGRTKTRRVPSEPRAAQVTATARFAGPVASTSAGTSTSVRWRLTASVSFVASSRSADSDTPHTAMDASTTRNAPP